MKTMYGIVIAVFCFFSIGWSSGWNVDQNIYNLNVDGTIYSNGIAVTSGNYVCYNTTTKAFYVKSACP